MDASNVHPTKRVRFMRSRRQLILALLAGLAAIGIASIEDLQKIGNDPGPEDCE